MNSIKEIVLLNMFHVHMLVLHAEINFIVGLVYTC